MYRPAAILGEITSGRNRGTAELHPHDRSRWTQRRVRVNDFETASHKFMEQRPCLLQSLACVFSPPRGAPASGSSSESGVKARGTPSGRARSAPDAGLTGGESRVIAVAAAREGTAEERTPGGSAETSGSEEEPRAWQPHGPCDSTAPRVTCFANAGAGVATLCPASGWLTAVSAGVAAATRARDGVCARGSAIGAEPVRHAGRHGARGAGSSARGQSTG